MSSPTLGWYEKRSIEDGHLPLSGLEPSTSTVIAKLLRAMTSVSSLEATLEIVMDAALETSGLEGGSVCMVTSDGYLDLVAERGVSAATQKDLTENAIKVGDCLCGDVASSACPLILRGEEEVQMYASREVLRGEKITHHSAFPAIAGGTVVGVVCVFSREGIEPTDSSLLTVEAISHHAGLAIERAWLYDQLKERADGLERAVLARTEKLDEANKRLMEVDQLKNVFIASMSHELRTPLNSILGFSGILTSGAAGELEEEQERQVRMINDSARRLSHLVEDLIDVASIEAGHMRCEATDTDVEFVVRTVCEAVRPEAEEKGLELVFVGCPCRAATDGKRLEQAVWNLLSNSIKYTESGSVTVECRPVNGRVEISVADTGEGIAPSDIERILLPFERAGDHEHHGIPGSGLGLYITKRVVEEALMGDLIVESAPGEGSTFTISMPVACD